MNKILSIVIPYFNETPHELLLPVFSVAGQAGIDLEQIECVLVRDGGTEELPAWFFETFQNLRVRPLYLPQNGGPGIARQAGIDGALGEYVMFCDADDALHNILIVRTFLAEIEAHRPDIIFGSVMMEKFDSQTGARSFPVHGDARHLMHGKAYRRAFLQENDVRFCEGMRIYEDTYFNGLAFSFTQNVRTVPDVAYVRKYRPTSLTRADDRTYFLQTLPDYIRCIGRLCGKLEPVKPDMTQIYMVKFSAYFYFTLQKKHWKTNGQEALLEKAERAFLQEMIPFLSYFERASAESVKAAYDALRPDYFTGETETEPLNDWLKRIASMGK
jgi:glycosyltransferase involved in cell wall biosynthesis